MRNGISGRTVEVTGEMKGGRVPFKKTQLSARIGHFHFGSQGRKPQKLLSANSELGHMRSCWGHFTEILHNILVEGPREQILAKEK